MPLSTPCSSMFVGNKRQVLSCRGPTAFISEHTGTLHREPSARHLTTASVAASSSLPVSKCLQLQILLLLRHHPNYRAPPRKAGAALAASDCSLPAQVYPRCTTVGLAWQIRPRFRRRMHQIVCSIEYKVPRFLSHGLAINSRGFPNKNPVHIATRRVCPCQ